MRAILGIVGLLVVVAVVGLIAKRQLQAVAPSVAAVTASSAPGASTAGGSAPGPATLPQRVGDEVKKSLEDGMRRNDAEARP